MNLRLSSVITSLLGMECAVCKEHGDRCICETEYDEERTEDRLIRCEGCQGYECVCGDYDPCSKCKLYECMCDDYKPYVPCSTCNLFDCDCETGDNCETGNNTELYPVSFTVEAEFRRLYEWYD